MLHGQRNIYHVGATVTNQWRLESMISLREECESKAAALGVSMEQSRMADRASGCSAAPCDQTLKIGEEEVRFR